MFVYLLNLNNMNYTVRNQKELDVITKAMKSHGFNEDGFTSAHVSILGTPILTKEFASWDKDKEKTLHAPKGTTGIHYKDNSVRIIHPDFNLVYTNCNNISVIL